MLLLSQTENAEKREKNLEEAKKITIEEDSSLPQAKQVLKSDMYIFLVLKGRNHIYFSFQSFLVL